MSVRLNRLFSLSILITAILFLLAAGNMALARAVKAETAVSQPEAPLTKVVQGVVQTRGQEPVQQAQVVAHGVNQDRRVTTLTGTDGYYELILAPGLWAVSVEAISATVPAAWIYPHEAQSVEFRYDVEPETHEVNFTVILADAAITGVVEMPDGSVPPFPVTVNLRNGEGYGAQTMIDPASGEFSIALPHGRYDIFIHPHHDGYSAPYLEPVLLPPGETVHIGMVTLMTRDATITGTVMDNLGVGVAGVPVTAWQRSRDGLLTTRTITGGLYSLAVYSGTWHVQPALGPDFPYLYLGGGETVAVSAGETITNIDFELLAADATIIGQLVTEDGAPVLDVHGWGLAVNTGDPDIQNGAPVREGTFTIHIPGGHYLVSVRLPAGSPYVAPAGAATSVAPGGIVTVTIPLREKDGQIGGGLIDPRRDNFPVTNVPGSVSAWNGDHWLKTPIRPDAGTYALGVTAGVWHLDYDIDSEQYVKLGSASNIPVASGQTVNWPLPVTRRDGIIAGQVLAPDGSLLTGAVVFAQGMGELEGLRLHTRTNYSGLFQFHLPHGRYRIGASFARDGWLNPIKWDVGVEPDGVVEGIILQFLEPDAALSGNLTIENTQAEGRVHLWAWSEAGSFTTGEAAVSQADPGGPAAGSYELAVLSESMWHVGAVFETENEFWIGRNQVKVTGASAQLDLVLAGPHPKPAPVVVTFAANEAQALVLADGTEIFVPAGALPVDGMVTLKIVPIATLPQQRQARLIQYGYAFFAADEMGRPIEASFNHHVLIRFQYDEHELVGREHRLRPAYFSTTTNEWTIPEHFVVEPDRNLVTMEIDHFTNFALVESASTIPTYLPVVEN